jgi:hypothetical protein
VGTVLGCTGSLARPQITARSQPDSSPPRTRTSVMGAAVSHRFTDGKDRRASCGACTRGGSGASLSTPGRARDNASGIQSHAGGMVLVNNPEKTAPPKSSISSSGAGFLSVSRDKPFPNPVCRGDRRDLFHKPRLLGRLQCSNCPDYRNSPKNWSSAVDPESGVTAGFLRTCSFRGTPDGTAASAATGWGCPPAVVHRRRQLAFRGIGGTIT